MADDIVTRLRHAEDNGICEWQVLTIAADEIERLREQIRWSSDRASEWKLETYELNTEIERLRAAGDALHAAVRNHDLTEAHLKAWQEARRG